jgi:hypothetical protein
MTWARRLAVELDVGELGLIGSVRSREAVPAFIFLGTPRALVGA